MTAVVSLNVPSIVFRTSYHGAGRSRWAEEGCGICLSTTGRTRGGPTTREVIMQYITAHPATHVRMLSRELGLAMGEIQYHLGVLERDGMVRSVRRGFYRFVYPAGIFGEKESAVLSVLSQETPRAILLSLIGNPYSTQSQLSISLKLSQPTISWHLKRLREQGLVEPAGQDRPGYKVASDISSIVGELLKNYHPTVWDRWSSRLGDIFIEISRGPRDEKE